MLRKLASLLFGLVSGTDPEECHGNPASDSALQGILENNNINGMQLAVIQFPLPPFF
ncbi:hypothetical protein KQ306_03915 [Synechococcus sp. CS-1324]|uniref:hypothetical protein n=1 Tax=Synechococcus sp. CS-1324 TaxID=2847980 RepID=UPI00223B9A52|nr:hypothetical protein [Synechococcus sp. CS-1324]MCT0230009.1 hypothetical protein [Synechococcus sp. CS-1324]